MESRIAQYFGWGITQYGSISDTDFDIVDEGRLAAYFDADIRQDKKQIEKCKNIFNKIPAQSEKVLENKGFPYVDRFLEKYCQKLKLWCQLVLHLRKNFRVPCYRKCYSYKSCSKC